MRGSLQIIVHIDDGYMGGGGNTEENLIYVDDREANRIEHNHHYFKQSHVYILIAREVKDIDPDVIGMHNRYGGVIGYNQLKNDIGRTEGIMHEFGHCVGIGNDDKVAEEVYCDYCAMGKYGQKERAYYCNACWDTIFLDPSDSRSTGPFTCYYCKTSIDDREIYPWRNIGVNS